MFRVRPAVQAVRSCGLVGFRASRSFSAASVCRSSTPEPKIVAKTEADAEAIRVGLSRLLAESGPGRWSLTVAGDGVQRAFKFKTFTKTWDFMTAVSLQCKLKNHHPEWSNVFNSTFVRWTTHSPVPGLTRKDVELAAVCDSLARDFGEIVDDSAKPAALASAVALEDLPSQITDCGCSTPETGGKN